MTIEEMINDLCTRATTLYVSNQNDIVAVGLSSHKDIPNYWQAWFEVVGPRGKIKQPKLDNNKSLVEGKNLLLALEGLDIWLSLQENQTLMIEAQRFEIVESIGFGD